MATSDERPEEAEAPAPAIARTKSGVKVEPGDLIALPRTMSEEWMAAEVNDEAYEEDKRRPPWLIPAIASAVAIIAIGAVFVLGGGEPETKPAPRVASAVAPAPPVVVAAPIDAATVAQAPIDALEVAAVPADAAVAAVAVDAPVVAAVPADAAVVAAVAADAAVPVIAPPKPKAPPPPPPPPKEERTIEQLVDAKEFAKANAACATNTRFSTPRLLACALAACQTDSSALAQRWVRALPRASADEMLATCKALGVALDPP